MLLRTQGRMTEAQRVIESALVNNPADPVLLNSRGTLALAMQDQAKAIQDFSAAMRELIATDPERALAEALPWSVEAALPPVIRAELERRVAETGVGSVT